MLEAPPNATASGIILFTEGAAPELHFPRMMGWSVVLKDPDVYVVEAHQPGFEAVLVVVDPDITATVCLHDLGGNSVETPLILSMFGY